MSEPTSKRVREGQAHKRAAILATARELFVDTGVERISMDAVAVGAEVSKRTVYDYYGDKRRLLLAVIEDSGESALATLRRTIDTHLRDSIAIDAAAELEVALTDFAVDLGGSLMASSDYAAAVQLIAANHAILPELDEHPLDEAHAQALTERLGHFVRRGLLDTDDPRLAADHFNALTTLRVLNEHGAKRADRERVRRIMIDGVHAFMRAYGSLPVRGASGA